MPRLFALVSATLFAAACSSHPTQGTGSAAGSAGSAAGSAGSAAAGSAGGSAAARSAGAGSAGSASQAAPAAKPASTLAQVQASVSDGSRVAPAGLAVPGVDLFLVTETKPSPDDDGLPPRLVGVAGGAGGTLLDGRDLVRAVIDGKPTPRALAQVALWVAQDDGDLIDAAKTREQRKAKVGPPALAGGRLGFWALTTDVPRQVEHGSLDLSNGLLDLTPLPLALSQTVSNAMTTLGSVAVSRHAAAIKALAAVCSDARARQALLAALSNHPRTKTRAAIADEAHRCGGAAVDPLVTAMEQDKSGLVRRQAAAALGRIGDPRARPALAKAVRGDDANLAYTAGNALKKIQ